MVEGDKYSISDVEVIGDIPFEKELYQDITNSLKDLTYNHAQITGIEEFFKSILGNQGYAFAEVSGNPDIDEESQEVKIIFSIEPGNRTYTRKILFSGNEVTLLNINWAKF